MKDPFRFRQFSVSDENCAMMLGTDAVLLGIWVPGGVTGSILDIGTGCGILALMMAQKSQASITGIDIHLPSVITAKKNFDACPWKSRLQARHESLQDLVAGESEKFDFILSNPPYFVDSLQSPDPTRNLSRHARTLPMVDLLRGVDVLLTPEGRFAMIVPSEKEIPVFDLAASTGLFPSRIMHVIPKEGKLKSRTCMEFCRMKGIPLIQELTLRNADGKFTKEYRDISQEFYLWENP